MLAAAEARRGNARVARPIERDALMIPSCSGNTPKMSVPTPVQLLQLLLLLKLGMQSFCLGVQK